MQIDNNVFSKKVVRKDTLKKLRNVICVIGIVKM